jgi:hypothetical protein
MYNGKHGAIAGVEKIETNCRTDDWVINQCQAHVVSSCTGFDDGGFKYLDSASPIYHGAVARREITSPDGLVAGIPHS